MIDKKVLGKRIEAALGETISFDNNCVVTFDGNGVTEIADIRNPLKPRGFVLIEPLESQPYSQTIATVRGRYEHELGFEIINYHEGGAEAMFSWEARS